MSFISSHVSAVEASSHLLQPLFTRADEARDQARRGNILVSYTHLYVFYTLEVILHVKKKRVSTMSYVLFEGTFYAWFGIVHKSGHFGLR